MLSPLRPLFLCDGPTMIPVILVDELIHTDATPFCLDETCPCHEDPELIADVDSFVLDGLLTPEEATCFVAGRSLAVRWPGMAERDERDHQSKEARP